MNSFYVGSTHVTLEERLGKHQEGFYDQSYSQKAADWEVFLTIKCQSFGQARKIENHIKRMKSRKYFQSMKQYPAVIDRLLSKYSAK